MNQYITYFIGSVVAISLYYILQNRKTKFNSVDVGFGFIPNNYPILTIYISGNYFTNKKNPLSNPDGIPEDSYFLVSIDNKFSDYIGAVPSEKIQEIKKLLVHGTADELLNSFSLTSAPDVDKKYYEDRIEFAKQQLDMMK